MQYQRNTFSNSPCKLTTSNVPFPGLFDLIATMSEPQDETRPLLASSAPTESNPNLASRVLPSSPPSGVETQQAKQLQRRWISSTVVVFVLFILLAAFLLFGGHDWESKWLLRGDPYKAANRVLERWPVIVCLPTISILLLQCTL